MKENTTRRRLLDAAEQLFARQGCANTSLRAITARAEANLAAVNYHFGSKDGLMAAMLDRRLTPFNKKRVELLEAELAAAGEENRRPDAEILMRAYIEPAIHIFLSEEGGEHFLRMFSRIHADPEDAVLHEFLKHMAPVFIRFFEAFKKALPDIEPKKLTSRILFCVGAMGLGAGMLVDEVFNRHAPQLGASTPPDADALLEELIGFLVRGLGTT